MSWFQDRPGTLAKDAGNPKVIAAADYDMNFPFKTLGQWAQQMCVLRKDPNHDKLCATLKGASPRMQWLDLSIPFETDYQGRPIKTEP